MGVKFLVLVVIVLVVIAAAQLMRVSELSKKIRGRKEEEVDLKANNFNAFLMLVFVIVFFGQFIYMLFKYGNGMLPEAASEHGQEVDWLFNINWAVIFVVFFLTNSLLFFFAYKYAYNPNRKAYWFPHDNKLEMLWTVVPAATLSVIIILGLMTWNNITGKPSDDAMVVELYAKQFNWTARYSGDDNKLGYADYKLVSTDANNPNPLGVITANNIDHRIGELDKEIKKLYTALHNDSLGLESYSSANLHTMEKRMEKLSRIRERVVTMKETYTDSIGNLANDDFTATELFLIKDQEYFFVFRSQDVIHSAYFPHFRAQMNCVPGQRTTLKFKPIYTTTEMRQITGNKDFNFILMCNKICGVSHSAMKMDVTVGTLEEYDAWKKDRNITTMVVPQNTADTDEVPVVAEEVPAVEEGNGEEAPAEGGH